MLRPTVSRSVCLGIKHASGAYYQIFISVRLLRVCWCGKLSLTRGRVGRLQFLLGLTSAAIVGSESRGTSDHILLSQIRDFPFRRLLRLAGLQWSYCTPPPHGMTAFWSKFPVIACQYSHECKLNTCPRKRRLDFQESISTETCLSSRFLAMGLHVTIYLYYSLHEAPHYAVFRIRLPRAPA
jgi:hypothetical protein